MNAYDKALVHGQEVGLACQRELGDSHMAGKIKSILCVTYVHSKNFATINFDVCYAILTFHAYV